jgi:murein DD-endopeptidase MepM/ murein hydrolase activator NlpD
MPRVSSRALVAAAAASLALAAPAGAHTISSGETFWSIATANGLTPDQLAAANGLQSSSLILPGQHLYVPPAPAQPVYSAPVATTSATSTPVSTAAPAAGMVPVSGPAGTAYLPPSAAQNLAALRQQSMRKLGVDVYPAGPLSGYRTYAQQAELYRLYLAGQGPLAAPPGTSEHEYGRALDVATPSGRSAVDQLGSPYGWTKWDAPSEWWHVDYTGP